MYAYEKFHDGKMSDYIPSDEELKEALAKLPKVPEKLINIVSARCLKIEKCRCKNHFELSM